MSKEAKEVKTKDLKIKDRISRSFTQVTLILCIASVVSIIALFVMASRYEHAMHNYGFSQGDIGKAMTVLTDTRSAVRGAIGYETTDEIQKLVTQYCEQKEAFWKYMAVVEVCMVPPEGIASYEDIVE